jgi:hypothetical protein
MGIIGLSNLLVLFQIEGRSKLAIGLSSLGLEVYLKRIEKAFRTAGEVFVLLFVDRGYYLVGPIASYEGAVFDDFFRGFVNALLPRLFLDGDRSLTEQLTVLDNAL